MLAFELYYLEIPIDDKLLMRKLVKQEDPSANHIFEHFKRERSYAELQVKLRKHIQQLKQQRKNEHMKMEK